MLVEDKIEIKKRDEKTLKLVKLNEFINALKEK